MAQIDFKKQKQNALSAMVPVLAYASTMSALSIDDEQSSQQIIIELQTLDNLDDFEFSDIIMKNRFVSDAKKASNEDGVYISIQKVLSENQGTIDAVSVSELVALVSTLALLSGTMPHLKFYSEVVSPTLTILATALSEPMDSTYKSRAFESALTASSEINIEMDKLRNGANPESTENNKN